LAALIPEGEVVDFGAEKERRQISES